MNILNDLLEQDQKNITEGYYKDLDIKAREAKIEKANKNAQTAFWIAVAKSFPDVKPGAFSAEAAKKFEEACNAVIDAWLSANDK